MSYSTSRLLPKQEQRHKEKPKKGRAGKQAQATDKKYDTNSKNRSTIASKNKKGEDRTE
jgi:hypothetical protein